MAEVDLTPDEIRAVHLALRWGTPSPEPDLISSARSKLLAASNEVRWEEDDE